MITNPLSLNLYTYGYNNPLRYIDPSGHIVTKWDKANLSYSERQEIQELTDAWWAASTAEARAEIHAKAEAIRDLHRGDNEIGTEDGFTVYEDSGEVIIPSSIFEVGVGYGLGLKAHVNTL